ncbi:MAG: FMN-binding protein [Syntrophomonadaceae bacterium]|nr:FMN-binding protein [Syntrophomonadaceae bacterium]
MAKKTGVFLCSLLLVLALISGCGSSSSSYKDGVFIGKSTEDDRGAYGEVTLTIKSGEIAGCQFVTWQKDGSVKDEEYGKVNGVIANQDYYDKAQLAVTAMARYAGQLEEVKRLDAVDVVSGATNSYDQFTEAVQSALEQAEK